MTPYIAPTNVSICYVDYVLDGDTISCDKFRIRLCGIDAAEKSQSYGKAATTLLTKLVSGKNVRIVGNSLDSYGRILGEVWIDNRLVNAEMVRAGLAYTYGSCPTQKSVLENAEKSAIAGKVGVWQTEQMRPWIYRKYKHQLP